MKRVLVAAVGLAVLAAACLQPVDVGSSFQPVSSAGTGGEQWGPDGSVPCGQACVGVDAGPGCGGDRFIQSAQEWAAFVQLGCVHFDGNLEIRAPDLTVLSSEMLQTVSGKLSVSFSGGLTSVSFPELTFLGGRLDLVSLNQLESASFPKLANSGAPTLVSNPLLTSLNLPALTLIRGDLQMSSNGLTALRLPALTEVRGGTVTFWQHAALTTIDLPVLRSVGNSLGIQENGSLTTLNLPVLAVLPGGLGVSSNALTTLSLPSLTAVGGAATIDHDAALTTIDLPVLRSVGDRGLEIQQNGSLTTLNLPALTTVLMALNVYDNAQLRQCLVDALLLQLTPAPITYLMGNAGMPNTCP